MEKIEAEHEYIKDLFDGENLFEIPDFQRPFAWEKDNFEQLIDDIKDALLVNKENFKDFNEFEPYFLGSLIRLQQEENGDYKYLIIDGQQRLVSLVILIAVIRDLMGEETQNELQSYIYQEPKAIIDQKEQSRVEIRLKERDFFREYILEKGGTLKRNQLDQNSFKALTEPKKRMITAIDVFKDSLNDNGFEDNVFIKDYVKYLLKKVIMVVITTKSFESAFRLFNVVNARGMPLTNADLLKSENLGGVSNEIRDGYTKIWEDIEEEIGIEKMEMLIGFIRSIKIKKKARKSVFDEFQHIIFIDEPEFKGVKFIEYLQQVNNVYLNRIVESRINSLNIEKEVHFHNLMSIMRDFLPFNDWMSAVIKFDEKFKDDDYLYEFLKNLERKIFIDWLIGMSLSERLTQIYRIIRLIEENDNMHSILNDPIFHEDIKKQREKFKTSINYENFYGKGRFQIAKYVLLRIDIERNENLHKKVSFTGNITVEHILPQKPNHYWKKKFTEKAMQEWTNKLGNLTLLNGAKNSRASNKSFDDKVKTYFKKKSDFATTNELERVEDWNLVAIKKRHTNLRSEARVIWIESA